MNSQNKTPHQRELERGFYQLKKGFQMTDLSLPLCRASDPITSFEAADRVKEFQADHCTRILSALKRMGQAGAEQIAALTSLDAYQVRKRLADLQKRDLVQPHQETRLTATGRRERIWGIV